MRRPLVKAGGAEMGSEFRSAGTESSKGKKQKNIEVIGCKSEEWLRLAFSKCMHITSCSIYQQKESSASLQRNSDDLRLSIYLSKGLERTGYSLGKETCKPPRTSILSLNNNKKKKSVLKMGKRHEGLDYQGGYMDGKKHKKRR